MAKTTIPPRRSRWMLASALALAIVVIGLLVWSAAAPKPSAPSITAAPTHSTSSTHAKPLTAPGSSVASDAQFLSDVTEVDPTLTTYEKQAGNVALRSLLTDGSAFCAFLQRDGDMDTAMVSVVVGARQVEAQTHLPLSVTTFNAVDSVALLTLCPSLQSVVPSSDLAKIRKLGAELTTGPN
jgi:hypothetical protein